MAIVAAVLTLGTGVTARGATLLYRTDAELVSQASRVVRGRVLTVRAERSLSGAIHTLTQIAVLEDFTGLHDQVITIRELGGTLGGETFIVGGAVTYQPGSEIVVCLERLADGRYRSLAMGLSKFDVAQRRDGDAILLRNMAGSVVVGGAAAVSAALPLSEFRRLAADVRRVTPVEPLGADLLLPDYSAVQPFTLLTFGNGLGVRWTEADSGTPVRWYRSTAAPSPLTSGDSTAEIQTSLSAWTAPASASILLQYAGTTTESNTNGPWPTLGASAGVIFYEDPDNEISGSVLAIGGGSGSLNTGGTINGTLFNRFTRGFVIFQNAAALSTGFRQSLNFSRVLQHEIGHAIGLGHTQTDGSIANSTANIMYPSCCAAAAPVPPAIGADDLAGLNFIYPATSQPTCSFALSQSGASLGSSGGTVNVSVTTSPGCTWSVTGAPSWVTAAPASGTGSGATAVAIAANAVTSTRSATMAIAGRAFTVNQAGCTCTVSPSSLLVPAVGGAVSVGVNGTGCSWTAVSLRDWTSVSPAEGTGSRTISITVQPHSDAVGRTSWVTIGGSVLTVNQGGRARTADFNTDGRTDLVWQHADGRISTWLMSGITMVNGSLFVPGSVADPNWRIVGTWDVNNDGWTDLLWRHQTTGMVSTWMMAADRLTRGEVLSPSTVADTDWTVVGTGDFNHDGRPDILWQHKTGGWVSVWLMNGTTLVDGRLLTPSQVQDTNWKIVGVGDFNHDGRPDIVWQHQVNGLASVWIMNGTSMVSGTLLSPPGVTDANWKIRAVADLNADGWPDLVWQNVATGYLSGWFMNGTTRLDGVYLNPAQVADTGWQIVGPR